MSAPSSTTMLDLAARHGTPLYLYDQAALQAAAQAWQAAFGDHPHRVCYAVKANAHLAVLDTFAQLGLGFDIVSGGELARLLHLGVAADRIVFSGVGKTPDELRAALQAGIHSFNVESAFELTQLSALATALGCTARISLRVNPDVDAGTHPYISTGLKSNKFGIPHEHALGLYQTAAQLPGVAIVGLDCHIGSQITQIAPYVDALDRVLDLVDALQDHGIALKHLDLGGGLGIRYRDEAPPSPHDLVQALLARLKARGHGHLEVAVEPGRSLVGPAGWLLMRVLGLKMGETRSFCVVDAGMNDMMRPALYDAWMDIQVLSPHPPESAPASAVYDVVGPVCETGDWLGRDRALAVAPGDVLCLHGAGAYGMSMASNYNSRPHPAQFMRRADGQWHCISPRQSVQALWAQEQVLPPSA